MLALGLTVVVAVMPFRDLSGGKSTVGEAIRETVTTDLKESVRVVERGEIDRVLREQDLQAARADLDPGATIRVGRTLGATLMVTGAFQRVAARVRLTARFVAVETGEIVGTAKVDGAAVELLSLQDQVTDALLKSAGLKPRGKPIRRKPLKDLHAVELYGDAVVEPDDGKRRALLQQALAADPDFVYASRDLDELEKRMLRYAAAATREQGKQASGAADDFHALLERERDPARLLAAYDKFSEQLYEARRYRRLLAETAALLARPSLPAPVVESARANVVACHSELFHWDAVLAEGEKFLAQYPKSSSFNQIRERVDEAIERKREQENGAKSVVAMIKIEFNDHDRQNPCRMATMYKHYDQWKEARAYFEQCLASGRTDLPPGRLLHELTWVVYYLGDFKATADLLTKLHKDHPRSLDDLRQLDGKLPVDD